MIPDSASTLLALLGLVAPGLVFELRRERRRPQATETTFREASRVALTSLIFTLASLAVVIPLSSIWPALPNLGQWFREPEEYFPDHYREIAVFVLLELTIAIFLALLIELLGARQLRGNIVTGSVWYALFRRDAPLSTARIWLWITTQNGTQFKGPLRSYTPAETLDDREIAIGGAPILRLTPGSDEASGWTRLEGFDAVVVSSSNIRHFAVAYLDANGIPIAATPPASFWSRARARLARPTI